MCMAVLPNNILVTGSIDNSLKFWNLDSNECIKYIQKAHINGINSLAVLPNNVLITGSKDKFIKFWNLDSYECTKRILTRHKFRIR